MKTQPIRIIPRLDIKGPNLVKGVHLEGLRVLGKPEDFAKYYYQQGADELLYIDIVASLYRRNSLDEIIKKTAKKIFIPITVGGGLRTIADIRRVLQNGADKISINTAAINNPDFISKAANVFGSSTIAVTIEAIKQDDGSYLAFTDNGREYTGKEVVSWAKEAAERGAGEIIITSVDQEGTGKGFDLELTQKVRSVVGVPLVACGGAGNKKDILDVIKESNADAVNIASIFHYQYVLTHHSGEKKQYSEGNLDFLKNKKNFFNLENITIPKLKKYLMAHHIKCRI